MPDLRAILFDLDDTLYPYRAFVRSGFHAVGRHLGEERGLPARSVLQVLRRALSGGARGRELQVLCERFALPASLVPPLADVIREHSPSLRLPRQTMRTLTALRERRWKIGVVTNGTPRIQRRKIAALGLEPLVDTVVWATEHGSGTGKPDARPFHVALSRLGAEPSQAVFVGDDRRADIDGASAVGMHTIHLLPAAHRLSGAFACNCETIGISIHVHDIGEVPDTADRLVRMRAERHVF